MNPVEGLASPLRSQAEYGAGTKVSSPDTPNWPLQHSTVGITEPSERFVSAEVKRIIQGADLTVEEMSDRYFQTFHKWLPVIAPGLFRATVSNHLVETTPADFSVLLLTMFLITAPPHTDSTRPPVNRERLYSVTKSLFMQAQAKLNASVPLLQAEFLIAACEYACSRPEAAFISMGICATMAQMLNLRIPLVPLDNAQVNSEAREQEVNLLWGIAILERYAIDRLITAGVRH